MLAERFQADIPLQMFVFPVRDGTPLPAVFTKFAEVPAKPLSLPPADISAAPRHVDRAVDRHRAAVTASATTGRLPRAVRVAIGRGAARVPRRCSSPTRCSRSWGAGSCRSGRSTSTPWATCVTDAALRHIAWFTVWQATLSTVLTLAVGLPGRVRARALRVPRTARRARARDRAVRAPDGRGRRRRSWRCSARADRSGSLGLDQTLGAILVAHVFFNYSVVVRTVGEPLGAPRSPARGSGPHARCEPVRGRSAK